MLLAPPGSLDDGDDCVAVVIDEQDSPSWRPVHRALADAINAGKIAGFNLLWSLEPRERAVMGCICDIGAE